MDPNKEMKSKPERQIRAVFDDKTIRVYQAYSNAIADPAVHAGRFVSPPFKMDRMTWIKPSFLWMMYRSGWGKKPGQERILAIDITREGFEWALSHSCLSHFDQTAHTSRKEWRHLLDTCPVRIQWDPERDIYLNIMEQRTIQIGLTGEAIHKYVNEWITSITDITKIVKKAKTVDDRIRLLPLELPYELPSQITFQIGTHRNN